MRSSTRGRLSARRTARRSSGLLPLICARWRTTRRCGAPPRWRSATRDLALSESLAARVLLDVGEDEELPARMRPTRRLQDRARLAVRQIELVVAVVGVRLKDAGVSGEMRLRMLPAPVARVVEDRRGRPAAERPIVADIDPEPPRVVLPWSAPARWCRRRAGVRRHDMGLEAPEGIERHCDRAHGVDHGGERDRRALERIGRPAG